MAVTNKTKWAQLKVGMLALGALAILAFLIFLLSTVRPLFRSHTQAFTYMDNSHSIAEGSPVSLNGIQIGKVARVELSGLPQPDRAVKMTLQIDSRYLSNIPVDSQATLAAANLLGVKFIDIVRGKSPQTIMPGAEIPSGETAELEDLFKQGNTTLAAAQSLLSRMDAIVGQIEGGQGNLGKIIKDETLYNNLVDISKEFKQLSESLNQTLHSPDNSVGRLLTDNGALYNDVQGGVGRLNNLLKGVDEGQGTIGKLFKTTELSDDAHQFIEDARQTMTDARKLLASLNTTSTDLNSRIQVTIGKLDTTLDKINNGEGTIGRLMNDPALAEDLDGLMRETQGLMKDFRSNPKKFLHIKIGLF